MYAQSALKPNPLLRNGAYGIVMRGVQKCTCACASLRGRNYRPLCCIKLDTATDGACGTGGMLTVAQDRLLTLAKERGKKVSIHLFGQEIQPETYAICKADMLLKGDGEQAEHIVYGSTLSMDGNAKRQFDFMLANPPYGKSWKTDADKMGGKSEILDTRFNVYLDDKTELSMIPRTSDGQLLFLLNNVAKMKKDTPLGSRIAEVHNGSSIFTGDAGSGESNARRYMIEKDLVEAIIALPENMFYNTGIGTYIWVLSNRKEDRRKGKIQLIDATKMKSALRKNMGNKNCEITPAIREEIMRIFLEMEQSEVSKIFDNDEFGYWSVTVDRPLRYKVTVNVETIRETMSMFKVLYGVDVKIEENSIPDISNSDLLSFTENNPGVRAIKLPKSIGELEFKKIYHAYMKALMDFVRDEPYTDYNKFVEMMYENPNIKGKTKFKKFEDFMFPLLEKDPAAEIVYKNGEPVIDTELRDTEIIPFKYEGGIDAFIENEVKPYAPDAFVDDTKTQIGYEISFTKYFYKPAELRSMEDIIADLRALEQETDGMLADILGGIE